MQLVQPAICVTTNSVSAKQDQRKTNICAERYVPLHMLQQLLIAQRPKASMYAR